MTCGRARTLFGAYWDDEITQAERDWLESHFAACPGCRREYDELARTLEWVGTLPRTEVAPDLVERTVARARRASAAPDRVPGATPRWIPATAAASLVVIAATLVLQWTGWVERPGVAGRGAEGPVAQPVLVEEREAAPSDGAPRVVPPATAPAGNALLAVDPDSLFDRSEDVEFILDPVTLRKGRAHPVLRRPPTAVQGERAMITF
jgi:hypothetical protein